MREPKFVVVHETFHENCQFCSPAGSGSTVDEARTYIEEWLHYLKEKHESIAIRELSNDPAVNVIVRIGYLVTGEKAGQFKIYKMY